MFERNWFLSFEGPDNCGKTTQIRRLKERAEERGFEVVSVREPGGTPLSEEIRNILLHSKEAEGIAKWAECLLYLAARVQIVENVAVPALEEGCLVLFDRYVDSTTIYQGMARELGVQTVLDLNNLVTGGLMPELTFVFDIDLETSRERQSGDPDRLESESDDFHLAVVNGYRQLEEMFPERIVRVDGHGSVEEVHNEVVRVCNERLGLGL